MAGPNFEKLRQIWPPPIAPQPKDESEYQFTGAGPLSPLVATEPAARLPESKETPPPLSVDEQAWQMSKAALDNTLGNIMSSLGMGLNAAGRIAKGGAIDLMQGRLLPRPGRLLPDLQATGAALQGKEPSEEGLTPVQQGLASAAQTLPTIGAGMAASAAGIPAPVAFGGLMGSQAYEATKSPTEAAMSGLTGAIIPGVGHAGRKLITKILGNAVESGWLSEGRAGVQKLLEALGAQGAIQALIETLNIPEYVSLPPDKRAAAITRSLASNLAFLGLDIPNVLSLAPSMTQARLSAVPPNLNRIADALHQMVSDPYVSNALRSMVDDQVNRAASPQYGQRWTIPGWGTQTLPSPEAQQATISAAEAKQDVLDRINELSKSATPDRAQIEALQQQYRQLEEAEKNKNLPLPTERQRGLNVKVRQDTGEIGAIQPEGNLPPKPAAPAAQPKESDALQKQTPDALPVQPTPGDRGAMGEGIRQATQEPAGTQKEEEKTSRQAQGDVLLKGVPPDKIEAQGQIATQSSRVEVPGITAYHATPYRIDPEKGFDLTRAGMTEGAGHGPAIYASGKEAAEKRKTIHSPEIYFVDGKEVPFNFYTPLHTALQMASMLGVDRAMQSYQKADVDPIAQDFSNKVVAELEKLRGKKITSQPDEAHVLRVQLAVDPKDLLTSHERVTDPRALAVYHKHGGYMTAPKGRELFDSLAGALGASGARKALLDAGIQGLRYWDFSSMDKPAAQRDWNYAIYDPRRVNILDDNGVVRSLGQWRAEQDLRNYVNTEGVRGLVELFVETNKLPPEQQAQVQRAIAGMPSTELVLSVQSKLREAGLSPEIIQALMTGDLDAREAVREQFGIFQVGQAIRAKYLSYEVVPKGSVMDYIFKGTHPTGNLIPQTYTVTQESLGRALRQLLNIQSVLISRIVGPLREATLRDTGARQDAILEARDVVATRGTKIGSTGGNILLIDNTNTPIEMLAKLPTDRSFIRVVNATADLLNEIRTRMALRDPVYANSDFLGVSLSPGYFGFNIAGRVLYPKSDRNQILINLLTIIRQTRDYPLPGLSQPQQVARAIVETVLHELTHNKFRSDDREFTEELDFIRQQLDSNLREYEQQLIKALEEKRTVTDPETEPMGYEERSDTPLPPFKSHETETNYQQLLKHAVRVRDYEGRGDVFAYVGSRSDSLRRLLGAILGKKRTGQGPAGQGNLPSRPGAPPGQVQASANVGRAGGPTRAGILGRLFGRQPTPPPAPPAPPPAGAQTPLPPKPWMVAPSGAVPPVIPGGTPPGGWSPPPPPPPPPPGGPQPLGPPPPPPKPGVLPKVVTHVQQSLASWATDMEKLEHILVDKVIRVTDPSKIYLNIRLLRDAGDNLARVGGQKAGNHLRLMYPNPDGREAVPFAIEAGGQEFKLQQFENQINAAPADYDPVLKQKALDAVHWAMDHWRDPYFQKVVREARNMYNGQWGRERGAGIDVSHFPNYAGHYWDADYLFLGPGLPIVASQPTGGVAGRSIMKPRTFNTLADGIQAGYPFVTLDIAQLMEQRITSGEKLIQFRQWLNHWRNEVDPVDKLPIVRDPIRKRTKGGKIDVSAPPGYVLAEIYPGKRGQVAVHRGWASSINAMTSASFLRSGEGGALLLRAAAGIKHKLLFFDSYHLSFLAQTALAAKGSTTYRNGLALLEYSDRDLDAAVRAGEITPETAQYARSYRPIASLGLKNGLNVGKFSDALYEMLKRDLFGTRQFSRYVFDKVGRGLMMETFVNRMEKYMHENPTVRGDALNHAAREIAHQVNILFGNLGRQGIFKSQTARDIANLVMLAPGWNTAQVYRDLLAYKQGLEGIGAKLGARPTRQIKAGRTFTTKAGATVFQPPINLPTEARLGLLAKTLATGMLGYFVMAQLINYLSRGKPTWENEEDDMKLSAYIPDLLGRVMGREGPGYFMHTMGRFGEITHDLYRYYEQRKEGVPAIAQLLENKYGPMGRSLYVLLTQSDPFGHKIHSLAGLVTQIGLTTAPWPIMFGGMFSRRPGAFQKQLMSSVGIKTEFAPYASQQMHQKAREWNRINGKEPQIDIMYRAGAPYLDMMWAMRGDDFKGFRWAYNKAIDQKRTPREIRNNYRNWATAPFTGNNKNEQLFVQTLTPVEMQTYQKANEERRQLYAKFIEFENRLYLEKAAK